MAERSVFIRLSVKDGFCGGSDGRRPTRRQLQIDLAQFVAGSLRRL